MKALHFGAGKIGRGFIGSMLSRSGYEICFVDVNSEFVDLLNREGGYCVHVMDENSHVDRIENVRAICTEDSLLSDEFCSADLVTTSVSMKVLPIIAPSLAACITARRAAGVEKPLVVISCENGVRATSTLKGHVFESLSAEDREWCESHLSFVDCCVDHIVPAITFENPLDVASEEFEDWTVDANQLNGIDLKIKGLNISDDLLSHIERKLYTVNTGHCSIGYIGMLKGYRYIYEALADRELYDIIYEELHESGEALRRKFGFSAEDHERYILSILKRFQNPNLKDTTERVGRDCVRKLGPTLYFSYPISLAVRYGLPYDKLAYATAAGFHSPIPDDPQCEQIRKMIEEDGIETAITKVTGQTDSQVIAKIAHYYNQLKK